MGWNGSGGGSTPVKPKGKYPPSEASFAKQSGYRGAKKPSPVRGLVAGLVVVGLAAGAYFAFFSGAEKPQDEKTAEKERGLIKEVKPAQVPKTAKISTSETERRDPIREETVAPAKAVPPVVTNRTVYSTNCVTRPPDPNDPDSKLITSANQEIGSLLSTELGEQPIPFPYSFQVKNGDNGNDTFLQALKAKIEFRDTDTKEKSELKTKLLDSQLELIQGIKEGISFNDSMEEAYKLRVRAYETRKCFIEELAKMRESDPDIVEEGLMKVNESLAAEGIKKISREDIGLDDDEEAPQEGAYE